MDPRNNGGKPTIQNPKKKDARRIRQKYNKDAVIIFYFDPNGIGGAVDGMNEECTEVARLIYHDIVRLVKARFAPKPPPPPPPKNIILPPDKKIILPGQ